MYLIILFVGVQWACGLVFYGLVILLLILSTVRNVYICRSVSVHDVTDVKISYEKMLHNIVFLLCFVKIGGTRKMFPNMYKNIKDVKKIA